MDGPIRNTNILLIVVVPAAIRTRDLPNTRGDELLGVMSTYDLKMSIQVLRLSRGVLKRPRRLADLCDWYFCAVAWKTQRKSVSQQVQRSRLDATNTLFMHSLYKVNDINA
jgi:hypothetical protein